MCLMDIEGVKRLLLDAGHSIKAEERLGNNTGSGLRLTNGAIVNVYDSGTINVQGKNTDEIRKLLDTAVALLSSTRRKVRKIRCS